MSSIQHAESADALRMLFAGQTPDRSGALSNGFRIAFSSGSNSLADANGL